jgi:hypothetical protein
MIRRAWPITIALLAFSNDVLAGNCDAPETSGCVDADTFWPHAGPRRLMMVGGAETIAAGNVSFGLVTSWQVRPVVLRLPTGGEPVTKPAIDNQINTTFLFAWGVTKKLELEAALPVTIYQNGTGMQPVSGGESLHDTAARDLRFGAAYSIIPHVLARFEMSAPIGDKNGQLASDRSAVWIPSVSADFRRGRFFAGAEIGGRFRAVTGLVGARIGSQIVLAGGAGMDILEKQRLAVTVEARALPVLVEQGIAHQTDQGIVVSGGGGLIAPAEWMVSARSSPVEDLSLQLGIGGGLPPVDAPVTVPAFRIALAIVFTPMERHK